MSQTPPTSIPQPASDVLSLKYQSLCTQLGNATYKLKLIQNEIAEVTQEIKELDKLTPLILATERSAAERAVFDIARQSQGRKEPQTFHREPKTEPENPIPPSEIDKPDIMIVNQAELEAYTKLAEEESK